MKKCFLFIFMCLFIFSANAELKFRPEFGNKKSIFRARSQTTRLMTLPFSVTAANPFMAAKTMIIPPLQMSGSGFTLSCPTFENGSEWFLTIFLR